ncbi:sugar ABC transporter substrate-binding protein [Metabacillus bambusae]|uniref:Sugar ABC transporter substrate-binding protein n=1 Tax=Metabacillus bambusae TaxID=2795218 RepID=A0ABS3N5V3_9BACI|nr:sugar ABC transporter substrate-binding protein [Metabacillus bambusae]MBO1513429.1 sugar ABC transporter substrate-binding protein [Metabacillus bambusae]
MKKLFSFQMIILIMLVFTLVGCNTSNTTSESADSSSNEEKPKVVVVLQSLTSEYWNFVQAGAKQAFKDFNVDGTILGPSSESQVMEQINMMQDALTKGPDALVVSATQPETAIPTFNQYKENNIPVLLINQDVEWVDKVTFIGTDNFTAGKKGGELLASKLQKGDKVALIGGVLGSQTHRDRLDGAKEGLVAAGMEVVAEQPADSDKSKAMNVMENIIESNPELKGVFVSSDDMAMGASRGVQNKGVEVQVVGLDGTVESIESVIKGNTVGTVAQNPYDMGYKGVENAIKAIKGESVEKRIDTGAEVITKENAQERLDFLKSISE